MIRANLEDRVLESNTPWYCVSCYYCTVRCPQEIPITALMYTLKRMAIRRGEYHKDNHAEWSKTFVSFIERYGRAFEIGLMAHHYLTQKPLQGMRQSGLGINMMRKGRLNLVPDHIKNMRQLTDILNEARRIAAEEEEL
jgi:heterodisulfide reductase subunit C